MIVAVQAKETEHGRSKIPKLYQQKHTIRIKSVLGPGVRCDVATVRNVYNDNDDDQDDHEDSGYGQHGADRGHAAWLLCTGILHKMHEQTHTHESHECVTETHVCNLHIFHMLRVCARISRLQYSVPLTFAYRRQQQSKYIYIYLFCSDAFASAENNARNRHKFGRKAPRNASPTVDKFRSSLKLNSRGQFSVSL